jgi:predicted anti-sigma-YlaC factor YlaD
MVPHPSIEVPGAIRCCEVVECTTTYLEGYLQASARASMDSHLAFCAGCRAYVDQIASVREALRVLPGPVMGSTQRNRLREAFAVRRFD